jgi:F-type H+-transporting ATPase subunit epsilon
MYEKAFKLEIVTPRKIVFQAEATSLSAPGTRGGFQILYNHAPFLSSLEIGKLKVKDKQGADTVYSTSGGFVEVQDNRVVVVVETAESTKEIDIDRAKSAKQRAEERLLSRRKDIDVERARLALLRALNRLRVAGMA